MITSPADIQRRLVPRWRRLSLTVKSSELFSRKNSPLSLAGSNSSTSIDERIANWETAKSIVSAGELVESALVEGRPETAAAAASFLLNPEVPAAPEVKRLAEALFDMGMNAPLRVLPVTVTDGMAKHIWRRRLCQNPNNPLGWVELSLLQVVEGKHKDAERAMRVALALAPESRHVTRAAARLYLHLGALDHAHDVVLRNPATPHDPWLVAAEIALASVAERDSRFFRQGRRLLEDGSFGDRDITELAGSLATMELVDGRQKRSRDLFKRSVIEPTGNALAQAEWANPRFGLDLLEGRDLKIQDADEALAIHLYREEKFAEVVPVCLRWAQAERYSIRPYELGALSASEDENYETAVKLAENGLSIRPDASRLLNSAAYALASLGRLDEAEGYLRHVRTDETVPKLIALANRGLIAIKRGDTGRGVDYYAQAIRGFRADGDTRGAMRAYVFLAKVSAEAGLSFAPMLVANARTLLERFEPSALSRKIDLAEHRFQQATRGTIGQALRFAGLSDEQNKFLSDAVPLLELPEL